MQAMLAIQQQQQQLSHQVLGNDNLVPQASSPRNQNQNPDSMASSAVIEGSENKVLVSELNMTRLQEECVGGSIMSDDPNLEESIYHQLQDALAKVMSFSECFFYREKKKTLDTFILYFMNIIANDTQFFSNL
jgi:hypothetical protein